MASLLIAVHIMVSILLIGIVLIQGGKGAEIGSAFGGSSQTLFGSRGAATFLSKMTTVIAVVFMVTSLLLAVVSVRRSSIGAGSLIDQKEQTAPQSSQQGAPDKAGVKPVEIPASQQPPAK